MATARFGAVSDTLDADGEISPLDAPMPSEEEICAATTRLTGTLLQTPPMASAVKVGGRRLYDLHRRGETVEREARPVTVHSFTLLELAGESAAFEISCGSGTYVRSLIADLAAFLDTGAYLTTLRRTRVGHLTVDAAARLDHLSPNTIHNHIIPPGELLSHLPAVEVGEAEERLVRNGRPLGGPVPGGSFRVERGGEVLAVYRGNGETARAEVVLCAG